MSPKIILTQEEIDNFTIDVVQKYEGCVEAIVYLKRIYGDKVMNLRERKEDFVFLINQGKSMWIMNFLLNMMDKKDRVRFLLSQLPNHLWLLESEPLKEIVNRTYTYLEEYIVEEKEELLEKIKEDYIFLLDERNKVKESIGQLGPDPLSKDPKQFIQLISLSQALQGLMYPLEEPNGPHTRSTTRLIDSISEAYQWQLLKDNSVDHASELMKITAKELIKYLNFFVETI